MSESPALELRVSTEANSALSALDDLCNKLNQIRTAVSRGLGLEQAGQQVAGFAATIDRAVTNGVSKRVEKFAASLERLKSASSINFSGLQQSFNAPSALQYLRESMYETSQAGVGQLREELQAINNTLSEAAPVSNSAAACLRNVGRAAQEAGESAKRSANGFIKFLKSIARVVEFRAIRTVLKEITDGFKLGLSNMYEYAKGIGHAFAPAVDSIKDATFQMKNSIGAALAPALQAIIPYVVQIVNWFTQAINLVNQFFALLRGQSTWTRATNAAASTMDKVKAASSGAAQAIKEAKGLLADFDELNIIQQEQFDNASGGSGGSSGYLPIDYGSMFEEVSTFDKRVRNLVNWLKEHMDEIKKTVALIGIAIAGWMVSKAFDGFLGRLGSLIAGGATIVLGLKLSYDFGEKLGKNGLSGLSGLDIAKGILGPIASAIGGRLIFTGLGLPGGVGEVAGIAASVGVIILGYIKGFRENKLASRWGEVQLGADEIRKRALSMFSFDIESRINVLSSVIENEDSAKDELNEKISAFSLSLNKVEIDVDTSPDAVQALGQAAKDVVTSASAWLKTTGVTLEAVAKIAPVFEYDSEGNKTNVTGKVLETFSGLDAQLENGITDLGKQIASWMDAGTKSGWKNGEAEMIKELSERLKTIVGAAEDSAAYGQLIGKSAVALQGLSRDSAMGILNQQKDLIDQYGQTVRDSITRNIEDAYGKANMAQRFADTAKDDLERAKWQDLAKQYKDAAELLEGSFEASYAEAMENAVAPLREKWMKMLSNVFGSNELGMAGVGAESLAHGVLSSWGRENWTEKPASEIAEQYRTALKNSLDKVDPVLVEVADMLRISPFNLLPMDEQKRLVQGLRDSLDEDVFIDVMRDLGWKVEVPIGFTPKDDTTDAVASAAEEIEKALPQALKRKKNITGTAAPESMLSAEDAAKAVQKTYDALYDAINNYSSAGNVLDDYRFYDNSIKPLVDEAISKGGAQEAAQQISDHFYKKWLQSLYLEDWEGSTSGLINILQEDIENPENVLEFPEADTSRLTESVKTATNYVLDCVAVMQTALSGLGMSGVSSLSNLRLPTVQTKSVRYAAEGGMFTTGQMFIARERGPEIVGTMNGKSTVANNNQIVSGISAGVATANQEEVRTLNRIEALLNRIEKKEFAAKVVPSAELGKVNKRSADMYARNTGVYT